MTSLLCGLLPALWSLGTHSAQVTLQVSGNKEEIDLIARKLDAFDSPRFVCLTCF